MQLDFARTKRRSVRVVDMTSLIDIVFLLIVFFMLTSKFVTSGAINLDISTIQGTGISGSEDAVIVTLTGHDSFLLGEVEYPIEKLQGVMQTALKGRSDTEIVLVNSAESTVQDVVTAMDSIKAAGGYNISLSGGVS